MHYSRALLATAMAFASLTVANAREAGSPEKVAAAAQVAVAAPQVPHTLTFEPAWKADPAFQLSILKQITSRKSKSRDKTMVRWLDELGTLYAAEFAGPLWIEGEGLSSRAEGALEEMRRADEWGLSPAEYRVDTPAFGLSRPSQRARFELEFTLNLLKYADHASRGRFRPTEMSLWYERTDKNADTLSLLRDLASAQDPAALLVSQHPQHEGFKRLREVYLRRKFPERFDGTEVRKARKPAAIVLAKGPRISRGKRHPQIALLRKRLKVPAARIENEDLYDRELMNAVNKFMRTQGWRRKHIYDNKVRRALNQTNGGKKQRRRSRVTMNDIVANMEKWRWLPRELGDIHIWNNLPSFKTQVVKNDTVIHEERIIIGKTSTQTPVFSDTMTHVVFKPQWGVPNSIKIKSLLPRLAGGDLDVLRRRGMRIQFDKKVVSPRNYNWSRADITRIPIVMGAGSSNPLGRVKFIFPNHHAVYMHDTPKKHLFKSRKRTFSHGCIRVRNPVRLAEVVLGETSNWNDKMVASHLARRAKENNRIDLDQKVHVHNVYFTVMVNDDGELETLKDIYGHDRRIKQALAGKSLRLIASSDPARAQKREMERIAAHRPRYAPRSRRVKPSTVSYFQNNQYALGGPGYYQKPKKKKYKYKKAKYKYKKKKHSWSLNPYSPYGAFAGE
ncbi:MAG: L,D-transpeptidase family protein [Alphaproteobacteria bacterium]|nr:L,D-transpeptidase family protein [Alphaproteobacteria bacterium]